tara:strand:- start:1013 stop:1249 length:237 start_codon:yes stop_codon:yes gene_type:complete
MNLARDLEVKKMARIGFLTIGNFPIFYSDDNQKATACSMAQGFENLPFYRVKLGKAFKKNKVWVQPLYIKDAYAGSSF